MRLTLLPMLVSWAVVCCDSARPSPVAVQSAPTVPVIAAPAPAPLRGNTAHDSFSKAKKLLAGVYADHRESLYCGCKFDEQLVVDPSGCGYVPENNRAPAHRVEWEHVVPAEAFGQAFSEWRDGHPDCVDRKGKGFKGRPCARKAAPAFRFMEADMFNLYPAIGELNQRRSSRSMAMIAGEERAFGRCDFEVSDDKVEPRPEVRGDIARTYQYMDAAYPGRGIISGKNQKLFAAWSEEDPVDVWECERARRIARIQGNVNHIVAAACTAAGL